MAGRAKIYPQGPLSWGRREGEGAYWSEGHGPTLGGAKFFEMSFLHSKTYLTQISCCYL